MEWNERRSKDVEHITAELEICIWISGSNSVASAWLLADLPKPYSNPMMLANPSCTTESR